MRFFSSKYISNSFHRNILESYLFKYSGIAGNIIDIGSKNRRYDYLFSGEVTAIDIVGDKSKKVLSGDVYGLNFKKNSFDGILCLEVFEYLSDHKKAIEQMTRVLKPGGTLLLSTPLMNNFHQDKTRLTHIYLRELLKHRFREVEIFSIGNGLTIIADIARYYLTNVKPSFVRYLFYFPFLLFAPLVEVRGIKSPSKRFISGYFVVCKK